VDAVASGGGTQDLCGGGFQAGSGGEAYFVGEGDGGAVLGAGVEAGAQVRGVDARRSRTLWWHRGRFREADLSGLIRRSLLDSLSSIGK